MVSVCLQTDAADRQQFIDALPHWKYDNEKHYEMPAGIVHDAEKSMWLDLECTFQVCDGFHRLQVIMGCLLFFWLNWLVTVF
jgi:hypothetical protein